MAAKANPLNAAISFYGAPSVESKLLAKLPKTTPVHVHFGKLDKTKGLSDPGTADKLVALWFGLF
jgi:hypothetical protein